MTQKTINSFVNEFYSKGTKRNFITSKIDFNHFDDLWSLDILDINDYGPQIIEVKDMF